MDQSNTTPRRVGLLAATSIVVSSMIGVGVFTTSGFLLRDLGSPGLVLAAWAMGGVLALCGALTYAELGAALPQNGGEYYLLSRIYHPAVGFVAGWVSFVVGFSAPLAASALAFGEYAARTLPGVPPGLAALLAIGAFSALHAARVSMGSWVHSTVTIVQVALVSIFVVGGLLVGAPERLAQAPPPSSAVTLTSPAFAVGLIYVAFAYSGWNSAAYLAGEIRRPERTLPRALLLGAGTVTILYLGLNAAFLMAAPASDLAGVLEVGHVAATRLFGPAGGRVLSALIALCLLASIGAQLMTGARVYEAMGRDYPRLRVLAVRGGQSGPVVAVLLQAATAMALALTASFDALVTYVGFTLSVSALLTVLGVFVLRRREPDLARPYRAFGYPVTPLLAAAILAWMTVRALADGSLAPIAGLVTLALGLALYVAVRPSADSGERAAKAGERNARRPSR